MQQSKSDYDLSKHRARPPKAERRAAQERAQEAVSKTCRPKSEAGRSRTPPPPPAARRSQDDPPSAPGGSPASWVFKCCAPGKGGTTRPSCPIRQFRSPAHGSSYSLVEDRWVSTSAKGFHQSACTGGSSHFCCQGSPQMTEAATVRMPALPPRRNSVGQVEAGVG